jgi:hypothetical protein
VHTQLQRNLLSCRDSDFVQLVPRYSGLCLPAVTDTDLPVLVAGLLFVATEMPGLLQTVRTYRNCCRWLCRDSVDFVLVQNLKARVTCRYNTDYLAHREQRLIQAVSRIIARTVQSAGWHSGVGLDKALALDVVLPLCQPAPTFGSGLDAPAHCQDLQVLVFLLALAGTYQRDNSAAAKCITGCCSFS